MSVEFVVPKALRPGDLVRVIAPAGPFERQPFESGLSRLRSLFRVECSPGVYERDGFLAGSDERRLQELSAALECPEASAIVAARGGYGCSRIAHLAPFDALRRAPKWLVGFSDITALHCEALAVGVASLHAHNLTGLGGVSPSQWQDWAESLTRPDVPRQHTGLRDLRSGEAFGRLVGGNLSLLHSVALTRRWRPPAGAILFIEEVGEAPYRIDRMLNGLLHSGALEQIAAVAVGTISEAAPGPHGVTALEVFERFASDLAIPVVWGLAAGHGTSNLPMHLGMFARLDSGCLTTACTSEA